MSDKRICKYCGMELSEDVPHGLRECHLHAVARIAELEDQLEDWTNNGWAEDYKARIAELKGLVDELKPYRDGYDPEEVFPPEGEWVWLRDCDDNIEPVQYSHKTEWYWNYEGSWMPDDGDIVRWYPIGKLPEVTE